MTTPDDRDPPEAPGADETPAAEPHGLAEEIREEIAEVVEHVPEPVRWTVGKLVWLSLAAIVSLVVLVLVSVALYLANRTEWVAQEAALFLNQTLARNSDLVVQMKDVSGNPFRGLTVIAPRIRYRDGGPPVLEAPTMRITYSAWDLFLGRSRHAEVAIDHAVLRLARGSDGKLRLPQWKGGKPGAGKLTRIRVRLTDASVEIAGRTDGVGGGRLDLTISTLPTRLEVADLGWKTGPWGTRLDRLRGSLALGDSVSFRLDELRSPEVVATANGGWAHEKPVRVVHADIARIEWRLLHRITGNKDLDVTGEGRIVLDVSGDKDWRGHVAAHAVFDSLPGDVRGDLLLKDGQLVLSPLEAVTPAGHLKGHVQYSRAGWEVGGDVEHGDPSRWKAIHVPGWPAGDLNGGFRFVVDNHPGASDRLVARLVGSQMVGWVADSADVVVDFPEARPDSFTVRMRRSSGTMTLHGRIGEHGWAGTWSGEDLPLDEWPEGRASGIRGRMAAGSGTVEQRDGRLSVTGGLSGTVTDWLGIHTAKWNLKDVSGALLPKPDLKASAGLKDLFFLGVHFDSAAVSFHVGDQQVALEAVRAMAGDTTLTTRGHTEWDPHGWTVTLDAGEATSTQFHWTAAPPIQFDGDPRAVSFRRLELADGEARLSMTGKWALPGGGPYEWTGRGERLELARLGFPAEWGLTGRMDATLDVHGRSGDARWTLSASASDPGYQGHVADSIHVELAGAPSALELRELRFVMGDGSLLARGRVSNMQKSTPDTLIPSAVQSWISGAAEWQGALTAEHLPLDRVGRLVPAAQGLAGVLEGSATIGGRPGAPRFEARATLDRAAWHDYRVDRVAMQANYHDGQLEVPEIRMTRGKVVSVASGRMPLQLALGQRPDVPESPMAWTAEVKDGDLALLPLFVPQIGNASGRFSLDARVAGTARHPDLDGTLKVRDAVVRLAGREEVLEGVYADFHILPGQIRLDSLTARQGQRGRVSAHGSVQLKALGLEGYRFDLHLRDFAAVESGLYAAEVDGDFVVTDGIRVNRQTLPMVVGRANVRRAVVLFDFANQSEMQRLASATQPLFWTYRIQLNAVQNLHWRPPNGDIEFSADLNVEQTRDSLIIFGDMVSLRGTYYFLSNRFNVAKANLTFDNVGGVDPIVDAEATTRIAPGTTQGIGGGVVDTQPHTVTVRISGRANEPVLAFEDDRNEWDESVILQQLTLYRFYDPSKGPSLTTLGDPLDNYLTRAINRSVSADLSRMFGNYVTEWAVERQRGGLLRGEGDVVVSAGSQLSNRLSIKYSQVVPGFTRVTTTPLSTTNLFERDVEAEYRINRFFFITTEVAQRRTLVGTASNPSAAPDFNLNLKARWEY